MEKFIRSDFIYSVAVYNVSILFPFASNQAKEKKKEKKKKLHRLFFPSRGSLWKPAQGRDNNFSEILS